MSKRKKVTSLSEKLKENKEVEPMEEQVSMVVEESESEVYTLDLAKGLIFTDSEETKITWNPTLSDEAKDLIKKEVETLLPESQRKLETHLVSIFTEGALRSLYRELDEVRTNLWKLIDAHRNALRGVRLQEQWEEVCKKQQELRYCYPYVEHGVLSGTIDFKRIPEWAHMYIQEYMTRCLDNLMSLSD